MLKSTHLLTDGEKEARLKRVDLRVRIDDQGNDELPTV